MRVTRERTEVSQFCIDHETADKLYTALNAIVDNGNDPQNMLLINDASVLKQWFEHHLDEPDNHLVGMIADSGVINILEEFSRRHSPFEIIADNNIVYAQRGRVSLDGYESWRTLRRGSVVILKESRVFGRITKDVRIINEYTKVDVFVNREESTTETHCVGDMFIMPSKSVDPKTYLSSTCACLVRDREKETVRDVLNKFEKDLEEGVRKELGIVVPDRSCLTRMDLSTLNKDFDVFAGMTKETRDSFTMKYATMLKQKIQAKQTELDMEKGYVHYPSVAREKLGVRLDEYKWVMKQMEDLKMEITGCKNEVEKQTDILLQQLSVDGFVERRDTAVKNGFVSYLTKFGFVPDSIDEQVAMKCPKNVETIYSNKLIMDRVMLNPFSDPEFETVLKDQTELIRSLTEKYLKKVVVVLNELLNGVVDVPSSYDGIMKQASERADQNPDDATCKGYKRLAALYEQIKYQEPAPGTPLQETRNGVMAMKVLHTMQNEIDSVYHMWGYDAFYGFAKSVRYEDKSAVDRCAFNQSIIQKLREFESEKV